MLKRILSICLVGLLLVMAAPTLATDPTDRIWNRVADMTESRGEMGVAVLDGRIHTVGGFIVNTQLDFSDRHEVYDPTTDTWQALAPLPAPRHHPIAAAYDGSLYVFGGSSQMSFTPDDRAWVYDPDEDTWTAIAAMPATRMAAGAAVLDDFIYVAGGFGDPAQHLLRYDPAADAWDVLAPTAEVRDSAAVVVYDGQIWVIAGRSNSTFSAVEYTSVEIYDAENDVWMAGPPIQAQRAGFSAGVISNQLVITGGEVLRDGSPGTLNSTELYDAATNTWIDGPALPFGLHATGAAVVDDVFYLIGGATSFSVSDNVYVLVPRDWERP